ncbi:MAG TPA: alpha-2-macroglobulin family protein [Pyrinomonadaceae bacterium]|nr:alpha-2-macroglobulin family protein [Pyrinomonadaceae bacterium]
MSETHEELGKKGYSRYEDLNFAAYFTDLTTNRTEQRRFDLRVTKEAIHIYFIGETYYRSPNLPLTYFVSTFYADGTPVSANVSINGKYESEIQLKSIAQIKTNALGAGKIEFIAPKNTDVEKDLELKLVAIDGRGQTGSFEEGIDFSAGDKLQIRTDKAIYKPSETIKAEIVSTKKDGLVFVDLVSDWSVVESRFVQLKEGRGEIKFPFKPAFAGEMTIAAYTEIADEDEEAEIISDSRGIIFPKPQNLSLDANFSRETYRPNEEAKISFSILAPDKSPVESALGVVIFDKAIEERAKTDADFGGNYRGMFERFYGLLGLSESFGGISMKDLNEINTSKPISPDLQLAAELMLANNNYYPRIYRSREDFPQARSVFGEYLDRQLAPIEAALKNAYAKDYSRPADEISLRKILLENGMDFSSLRDPWGVGFRPKFEIEGANDVLDLQSSGADKKFDTKDDFTVLKMSFSYFLPIGKTIDRAVSDYYKATGAFIRDYKTLRDELRKQNFDLDNFRDRWNRPYRIEFGVNQRNFKIVFRSLGANGVVEEQNWNTDDFEAWTSEIDYFADTSVKIQNLLNDFAGEKGFFPKNEAEFKETLKKKSFDFEQIRDGYGQNVYLTFTTYSRFSDKLKIENTARYGENPSRKTTLEPVTQEVIAFKIRSKGEDFRQETADDFDLGFYSGVISEQSRTGEKTKPSFPLITSGGNGAIQGAVKDAMGAVIPGATIKATKNDTAEEFPAETEANGEYLIENLPSGKYSVRASSMGFKDSVISDVPVRASSITRADFTLEAGAIEETVTVSAGVVTVETTSSQISYGRGSGSGMGDGDGGGGGGGKKEENVSENQLQISTPRLREYFPETLVWNPEIITDKNGKAELKFKLADNITTWKLYTIASTKNGKIGVAEKEFRAFQPFFVDLEPPKFLTEGDEIFLPAQIRNYTEKNQKVDVSMAKSDWFSFLNSERQHIEVAPNNSENAVFGFKAISAIKDGKQRVAAIANKDSDAIEKPVTVRPNGQEIVKTESKIFRQTAAFNVDFPANALPKTQKAELKIYPNLFSHVAESVEGLLQRPYGCGEQTISSTYPNLMILKFSDAATRGNGEAEKKNSSSNSLREKAKRNLLKGYERLLGYQTASGGFSYWGGNDSADVALTAYAIRFLNDAKGFIEIDEEVIKKAQIWLNAQQRTDGSFAKKYSWENSEDASRTKLFTTYVARTLAMLHKDARQDELNAGETLSLQALQKALAYLKQRNSEIGEPYAMALFGLASLDAGNLEDASAIAERLEKMAIEEGDAVYWNLEDNTPFYGWGAAGRIETTALVLQLLIRDAETRGRGDAARDELISKATMFLLKNKDRYGVWYSTQTTINVLDAFLAALAETRTSARTENQNIEILLNGVNLQNISVSPDQITPVILDLSGKISSTENRIEIKSSANSSLMSQIVASHYIDWRDAEISSQNANGSRQIRLDYKCDRQTAEIMQEVVCSVKAERVSGYGMLLAEIGLPPGADVSRESLQAAMEADWSLSRYDVLPDRIILYMWSKAGGTRFNFKFKPRYGINAQTPASTIYDYYNEEAKATIAPLKFQVK